MNNWEDLLDLIGYAEDNLKRAKTEIKALRNALRGLIHASDELTSAIEGTTDQFDPEKEELMDATSVAEKVLEDTAEYGPDSTN